MGSCFYNENGEPLSEDEVRAEIKAERKAMVKETISTAVNKVSFIKEMKEGLGKEIKNKGGSVKIVEKTKKEKFIIWLKKIFTKF